VFSYNSGTLFLVSHVVPAILAEAFLLLTGCGGVVYLIQTSLLKRRSLDLLGSKLPSLASLETWMVWFSRGGLLLMTIGMVIGYVGLHGRSESVFLWIFTSWSTVGAFCGWFLLLMIVLGRQIFFRNSMHAQALCAVITIPIFVIVTFWARWFSTVNHFDLKPQVEVDQQP
jgi:ABC-type uncharacterized transport system permease subunit